MRRGYQLAKWQRKAETLHRKAVELANEIEESEGENRMSALAQDLHCYCSELVSCIEGSLDKLNKRDDGQSVKE